MRPRRLLVESDARAAAVVIESNIAALGRSGGRGAPRPGRPSWSQGSHGRPVDLVFADPPYEVDAGAIDAMSRARWLDARLGAARQRRRW